MHRRGGGADLPRAGHCVMRNQKPLRQGDMGQIAAQGQGAQAGAFNRPGQADLPGGWIISVRTTSSAA